MSTKHNWTKGDVLTAFYLYKYGCEDLHYSEERVLGLIGISKGSMKMAKQNFLALNGETYGALKNASKMGKQVYAEYNHLSQDVIRLEVVKYLRGKNE